MKKNHCQLEKSAYLCSMIIDIEMKKVETYEAKKQKAIHLLLDGKCSLNFAVAICFNNPKEAIKAINEIRNIFRLP